MKRFVLILMLILCFLSVSFAQEISEYEMLVFRAERYLSDEYLEEMSTLDIALEGYFLVVDLNAEVNKTSYMHLFSPAEYGAKMYNNKMGVSYLSRLYLKDFPDAFTLAEYAWDVSDKAMCALEELNDQWPEANEYIKRLNEITHVVENEVAYIASMEICVEDTLDLIFDEVLFDAYSTKVIE